MKSPIRLFLSMALTFVMLSAAVMLSAVEAQAQAQVPQLFNYQGIARDAKGNPLSNQTMTLKLSVLPTSDATAAEYEETQTVKTNEFGLYTLQIGNGTAVEGTMKTVKWESGNKYIRVAIDVNGGTNFVHAGTNQLLSVPYAIYADKAGVAVNTGSDKTRTGAVTSDATHSAADSRYLARFYNNNIIGKSVLYESAAGKIGLGTTAPGASFSLKTGAAGVIEHVRMQDTNAAGAGRFTMYNDNANAYATFTKYGTTYAGGYPGVASLYPYANLLAFGNNGSVANDGTGRFLISSGGNIGISMAKSGSSKLKFHADFATENVGIGGGALPSARVHLNNTDGADMTVAITNTTSGHLLTDGLLIRENGNAASIINRENSTLELGTNNTTRFTITAGGNTELTGQIKIAGGAPGLGKVLTSDANGLAIWQAPAATGITGSGTLNYIPLFTPNGTTLGNSQLLDNGTNVGLGTASPLAKLHVATTTDTAGFFTSNSANYLADGVLRGEYIGNEVYDHVGVYGKTLPDSNNAYGIGVRGDGGYMGGLFLGITKDNAVDVYGAYASGVGNADVFGISAIGLAQDTTTSIGNKVGLLAYAKDGLENRAVAAVAQSKSGNIAYGVRTVASGGGTNYALYATASVGGLNRAGFFSGDVEVTGNLSKGGGTFKIDHPQDPANKFLIHSFVESPDMKNIYDGNIISDASGFAIVNLPSYFEAENKDFRYQLTVIGKDARAYVVEKISNNQFKIKTSEATTEVSWQVTGIRKDAWADANRVIPEVEKTGAEKGKYIHPTLFGQPAQKGIHYSEKVEPILNIQTHLNNKNRK